MKIKTVDEYIVSFPKDVQLILRGIRETIKEVAPEAKEVTSYQMPAYKLNGSILVYFAAWKNHIGFYALPKANHEFKKELSHYEVAKGSIKFPLDQPMPLDLIRKIVEFWVKEIQCPDSN